MFKGKVTEKVEARLKGRRKALYGWYYKKGYVVRSFTMKEYYKANKNNFCETSFYISEGFNEGTYFSAKDVEFILIRKVMQTTEIKIK